MQRLIRCILMLHRRRTLEGNVWAMLPRDCVLIILRLALVPMIDQVERDDMELVRQYVHAIRVFFFLLFFFLYNM